jgi:hypothetical protein
MNDYLTRAIRLLKPTAEFSIIDSDYATVKWDVLEGDEPTQAQINEAIERVRSNEITEAATKATQRQALLERLGITEDEAKLLLG